MSKKKHNATNPKKYFAVIAFLIFVSQFLFSQDFKKTATAGFVFLEIPVTARTASLAEASLALSDVNSAAVFTNPGALGFTQLTHSVSASYSQWIAEIKNYASSYSLKTEFGVFGVGVVAFDYGTMPRTVVAAGQRVYDVVGTFKANSVSYGFTYSRMLTDHFSFGTTIKYAQETIDVYTASNVLFDGGVLYYTGLGNLRIAAAIQNFGINTKFINDEFKMPSVLKLGVATEVYEDRESELTITALAEALHPNNNNEKVNVGAEVGWKNMVMFRAGYKFFYDEETYSVGIGLHPQVPFPVGVDFAYSNYGRLGNISRLTIQIGLN